MASGDFDLGMLGGFQGPDPANLAIRWGTEGNLNYWGFANAEFDDLLVAGRRRPDAGRACAALLPGAGRFWPPSFRALLVALQTAHAGYSTGSPASGTTRTIRFGPVGMNRFTLTSWSSNSGSMGRYIARQLASIIPTIFLSIVINFILLHARAGRSGAGAWRGTTTRPKNRSRRFSERLGLDEPLPVQFWNYVKELAQGNLGQSLAFKQPVLDLIMDRMPATLLLTVTSCNPRAGHDRDVSRA